MASKDIWGDNARQMERVLGKFKDGAARRVERTGLTKAARVVAKETKRKARPVSRTVSKAIGTKTKTYKHSGTILAIVGVRKGRQYWVKKAGANSGDDDADYSKPNKIAHLLEYGTRPHTITRKSGATYQHPGAAANPYFRPAWDAIEDAAKAKIREATIDAVKKEARKAKSLK